MRYLSLDYGEKKIGIAISDPTNILAIEAHILLNDYNLGNPFENKIFQKISEILKSYNIDYIIVGMPYIGKDRLENNKTQEIRQFIDYLGEYLKQVTNNLPILEFVDEYGTTKEAKKYNLNNYDDATAAKILLQNYLDEL